MVERVLRGDDVTRELRDDAGEGVAGAVEVKSLGACLARVLLQIFDEAMLGE